MAVTGLAFAQGSVSWVSTSMSFTFIDAATNGTVYSPLFGGGVIQGTINGAGTVGNAGNATTGGIDYELLYGGINNAGIAVTGASAPSNSLSALLVYKDAGLSAINSGSAGRLIPTAGSSTVQASVPWPSTQTNNILLVGWSSDFATLAGANTWLSVSNALANWSSTYEALAAESGLQYYFGVSMVGYVEPDASSPGITLFGGAATYGQAIDDPAGAPVSLDLMPIPEPTTMVLAGLGGLSLLLLRRRK